MRIEELLSKIFPGKDAAWRSLLETTGILTMERFLHEGSPADLIEAMNACLQEKWIRPAGKEHWETTDEALSNHQKNIIRQAFEALNLYAEIAPTEKQYDAVLLMGALESLVRLRLAYLIACWHRGVRFDRIYALGSYRVLSPDQESMANTFKTTSVTETDMMMKIISDNVKQDVFAGVEIIYVNALRQPNAMRATSTDNITSWEKEKKENDHNLLLVTNQPYVVYQSAVACQMLSNNFYEKVTNVESRETYFKISDKYTIEAIGPRDDIYILTSGLDILARTFYASKDRFFITMLEK